ncbi:MAG: PD40 domain-containing protein [Anaerolineae bacterium]|nr:PD40 domain-containing protein [Anaerolineae bacterium]
MLRLMLPRRRALLTLLIVAVSGLAAAFVWGKADAQAPLPAGKIAYVVTEQDGSGQIWTMDSDGSNKVKLTSDAGVLNYYPSWSPDGLQIVFLSRSPDGRTESLQLMDADGGNRITVETIERLDEAGNEVRFFANTDTFSPDSRRLVYVVYALPTKTAPAETRMMLVNRNGAARREIPQGAAYDGNQVFWMSDNRLIIGFPDGIYTLNLVDGTETRVSEDVGWFAISPDEARLALFYYTDPDGLALDTMSINTGARQPIIALGEPLRTVAVQYPVSWSPDGAWIGIGVLYEYEAKPPAPDPGDPLPFTTTDGFYVFAAEQMGAFRLASDPYASWSPDGRFVVYAEAQQPDDPCTSVIAIVSTEDDTLVSLTDPGCNFQPAWGPDTSVR